MSIKKNILRRSVTEALKEDMAQNDITTRYFVPSKDKQQAVIIVKEAATLCGLDFAKAVFRKLDKNIRFKTVLKDGDDIKKNTKVAILYGKIRALLTGERTALNFLSYLSGITTQTRRYVKKVKPFPVKIFDTRKTTPGLRKLEKYAVRMGKGCNHRLHLNDMIMIKDNHRAVCLAQDALHKKINKIRNETKKLIEIEVDNLTQLKHALHVHPDIILLDNMRLQHIKKAVVMVKKIPQKTRPLLEASGGITLKNVRSIAETGVDRISIGALTHSHQSINFSLEMRT